MVLKNSGANFAAVAILVAALAVGGYFVFVQPALQPANGGAQPSFQGGAGPLVERSFSTGTLSEGQTLTVTIKVSTGGATYYAFDEVLPEGWVAVNTGLSTEHIGHAKMVVIEGAADATFSYDVVVSGKGARAFSGGYMFEGMANESAIAGSSSVTVQ
ncbi:MAG: hypothetical protein V1676_00815 [Candidatus Diapherotrites archaeon]